MICNFMLQYPDKTPTNFPQKIIRSFDSDQMLSVNKSFLKPDLNEFTPKLHTMRKGNRWRPGMTIHFYINARSKGATEFAKVPCTAVQKVFMKYQQNLDFLEIWVNHNKLSPSNINFLIRNDGLTYNRFIEFFFPLNYNLQDWEGQLIHWTDLRYPISRKAAPSGQYMALSQVPDDQMKAFKEYLQNNPSIIFKGIKGVSYENYSTWYDQWIGQGSEE